MHKIIYYSLISVLRLFINNNKQQTIMKKRILIFASIIALSTATFFTSCEKENPVELATNLEDSEEMQIDVRKYILGVIPMDTAEYLKIPAVVDEGFDKSVEAKKMIKCPEIGNQGLAGSCVGWGVGYAARSIRKKQDSNHKTFSKDKNIMSPAYLYNIYQKENNTCLSKGVCKTGSKISTVMGIVRDRGVCTWNKMKYYADKGCCKQPNKDQNADAKKNKIGFSRLSKIEASNIKSQINKDNPVIIKVPVNSSFYDLKSGAVLKKYDDSSSKGYHCVCIIGFDDEKKAFKFMNSWGKNWATKGFGYIHYDHVKEWIKEAYVFN